MLQLRLNMRNDGFTIVELLIVIVIIAILATLSIVAFNGIQQRSKNTQTITSAQSYYKGMVIYGQQNGKYPTFAGGGAAQFNCLGELYPSSRCWDNTALFSQNTAVNAALKTVMGNKLPMPAQNSTTPSGNLTGVIFIPADNGYGFNVDGVARDFIAYNVEGASTRCTVGPIVSFVSGANFSSTPPANEQTVLTAGTTTPSCWIALPKL